jgi:hypothetical protein
MLRSVNHFKPILRISVPVACAVLLLLNSVACKSAEPTQPRRAEQVEKPAMPIKQALKAHSHELMALSGVVGTAQGLCEESPCIKVYVIEKTPHLEKQIHNILKDYLYQIQETGEIRTRSD